jgi:hypothetical protein
MEKDFPSKWSLKTSQSSFTYINKTDFQLKLLRRNKEGHFIVISGK